MINGEGKRLKKFKTNGLAKLEEFLKDFPFGDENKPCHAELLPLEDNKKAENYLTCAGNKLDPTWYAKFVWLGDEPPNAGVSRVSTSLKASNSDSGTSYSFYANIFLILRQFTICQHSLNLNCDIIVASCRSLLPSNQWQSIKFGY